jgi:hypothetical protein
MGSPAAVPGRLEPCWFRRVAAPLAVPDSRQVHLLLVASRRPPPRRPPEAARQAAPGLRRPAALLHRPAALLHRPAAVLRHQIREQTWRRCRGECW